MGLFSTTWHNWPSKSIEFCGKKRKLRAITSFKVIIEVYINRKPLCDFLLVINSNWHPISYRFRDNHSSLFKFWTMRFWAPFEGLRAAYDDHLRLIGKRVVLTELFSLGVTAEAFRANIGWRSAISLHRRPVTRVQELSHTAHVHGHLQFLDLHAGTLLQDSRGDKNCSFFSEN